MNDPQLYLMLSQLDRVTCELREYLEHKRNMRQDLDDVVNHLRSERENDQSELAFAQIENDRAQLSCCNKLLVGRQGSLDAAERYPSFRHRLIVNTASSSLCRR